MNSCAKQGRWRGWQARSLLSHTHKEMPMLLYACTPPRRLWFVYMLFSCPLPSPSLAALPSPSSLPLSLFLLLLLTSPLVHVSSHQPLSFPLYEIMILLSSLPCLLPSKTHPFPFFLPLLSLSCDLLSAILILSYCLLSDVLLCPCVKCTLKMLCVGRLYWYRCQIKGVFHKATLLHAYIWVRICSPETALESVRSAIACNIVPCTVIWNVLFSPMGIYYLRCSIIKERRLLHKWM